MKKLILFPGLFSIRNNKFTLGLRFLQSQILPTNVAIEWNP